MLCEVIEEFKKYFLQIIGKQSISKISDPGHRDRYVNMRVHCYSIHDWNHALTLQKFSFRILPALAIKIRFLDKFKITRMGCGEDSTL